MGRHLARGMFGFYLSKKMWNEDAEGLCFLLFFPFGGISESGFGIGAELVINKNAATTTIFTPSA